MSERIPEPPVDYTTRDWSAFRDFLINAAGQKLPEWTSRSPSDFLMVMIELFSYVGDNLSFYVDRVANEGFLQTATRRSSVLNIARLFDYVPGAGAAAQAELRFNVVPDSGEVTIPAGTQVSTVDPQDPVTFETNEALVIDSNSVSSSDVMATEGVTIASEVLGTSPGGPNQFFPISQGSLIHGSLILTVDAGDGPREWRQVPSLVNAGATDPVYLVVEGEDRSAIVVFGDDVNGRTPLVGSQIEATYRIGGGERGNVAAGMITSLISDVSFVASVINNTAAVGGADPEALADIRMNAPRSLTTLHRAVTVEDHARLALRIPFVARAGAVTDLTGEDQRRVTVHVAPEGGGDPTSAQLEEVREFLQERTIIDYLIATEVPDYVEIDISVGIQINPSYDPERVITALSMALSRLHRFAAVDFGQRVTLASVYRVMSDTAGVDYGVINILDRGGDTGLADIALGPTEVPTTGEITVVDLEA